MEAAAAIFALRSTTWGTQSASYRWSAARSRGFLLVAFGGAGPVPAAYVAREVGRHPRAARSGRAVRHGGSGGRCAGGLQPNAHPRRANSVGSRVAEILRRTGRASAATAPGSCRRIRSPSAARRRALPGAEPRTQGRPPVGHRRSGPRGVARTSTRRTRFFGYDPPAKGLELVTFRVRRLPRTRKVHELATREPGRRTGAGGKPPARTLTDA